MQRYMRLFCQIDKPIKLNNSSVMRPNWLKTSQLILRPMCKIFIHTRYFCNVDFFNADMLWRDLKQYVRTLYVYIFLFFFFFFFFWEKCFRQNWKILLFMFQRCIYFAIKKFLYTFHAVFSLFNFSLSVFYNFVRWCYLSLKSFESF